MILNDEVYDQGARKNTETKYFLLGKICNRSIFKYFANFHLSEMRNEELKCYHHSLNKNTRFQIEYTLELYNKINYKKSCNKNDNSKTKGKGIEFSLLLPLSKNEENLNPEKFICRSIYSV